MGVTHLWSILAPVQKKVLLSELRGQTLAVDLGLWICEMQFINHNPMTFQTPYLRTLYFRILKLRQAGIKLVFVVDGEATDIKLQTMTKRYKKETADVISEVVLNRMKSRKNFRSVLRHCTQLLDTLGIPHLESEGEGEKLCSILNMKATVDGVITNDGDAFLYGAQRVLRNFKMSDKEPSFELYEAEAVWTQLGLTREHLITFGILVGCDYLPKGVAGIGKENAVRFLKTCSKPLHFFNEAYKISKDGEHCTVCKHEGTTHLLEGCRECRTPTLCSSAVKKLCCCPRHQKLTLNNHTLIFTLEKCLSMLEFPFKPIVKEFLDFQSQRIISRDALRWKCPSIRMFKTFASLVYLWDEPYCVQQFVNNCAVWCLNHELCKTKCREDCLADTFYPEQIVKRRKKNYEDHLEVIWTCPIVFAAVFDYVSLSDTGDILSTVEKLISVKERYPDLFAELEQKEKVKASRARKRKVKPPVSKIPGKENIKDFNYEVNQIYFSQNQLNHLNSKQTDDEELQEKIFRKPTVVCANPKTPGCAKCVEGKPGGVKRSHCFSPCMANGPPVSSTPRVTFTPYRGVSPQTFFRYIEARGKGFHSPIKNTHNAISTAAKVQSPSPYLNVEELPASAKKKLPMENPRRTLKVISLGVKKKDVQDCASSSGSDSDSELEVLEVSHSLEKDKSNDQHGSDKYGKMLPQSGEGVPPMGSDSEDDNARVLDLGNDDRPVFVEEQIDVTNCDDSDYKSDDGDIVCLEDIPLRERLKMQNVQCSNV